MLAQAVNENRLSPTGIDVWYGCTADDAAVSQLASGLLSGRYDEHTAFAPDDHRTYNRHGEAFDVGETFSGDDYRTGLEAVRRLLPLAPHGATR